MDKKWLFFAVFLGILGLASAGLVFIHFRNKEIVRNKPNIETALTLPDELSANFDPTQNTPIFKITSANKDEKTLVLEIIFPENKTSKEVTSLISCQEADIQILKNGSQIGAGIESFFGAINENPKERMTFSGYCGDKTCDEINRQCLLNIQ